jgi:hypothetical protein
MHDIDMEGLFPGDNNMQYFGLQTSARRKAGSGRK